MKRLKRGIIKLIAVVLFAGAGAGLQAENASISQSVVVQQPQVRVLGNQVEITVPGSEDCQVSVYSLTGQVVKVVTAVPGVNIIDLPKGYYIVKCDRVSCRVVVK